MHPSTGVHWSLLSPLVCDFRLNWLTHKTRCVRGSVSRRAFPRSDYYAPSDCLQGFGVFVGVSLAYFPLALTSLKQSPVFRMEDANGML